MAVSSPPGLGAGRLAHQLRGAKIGDLDEGRAAGPLREEEVPGLELAYDDAVAVRLGDRLGDHQDGEHGVRQRQGAVLPDVRAHIDAVEVLPHQVERPVRLCTDVDDPGDVLGLELRERPRLAPEALELALVAMA